MPVSTKERYHQLCAEKPVPFFMQAWWMDAVCGVDNWDVLLYEKEGSIVGAFPFLNYKKAIFRCIILPQLTQYNGFWIDYPQKINEKEKLSLENEIMNYFIERIEAKGLHYFNQNFHHSVTNFELLRSKGYTQTNRRTYVIRDLSNLKKVFEGFSYAKQKHIKKSESELVIDYTMSPDEFYNFHTACLKQKGEKIVYSHQLFSSIYEASVKRQQAVIISVKDKIGNLHAALFLVWDKHSAYYLISAIDSRYKSSGASTLMVWEAINYVSDKTSVFDFEGSMIESVANSFKQFGTEKIAYSNISKNFSFIFGLLMRLRK